MQGKFPESQRDKGPGSRGLIWQTQGKLGVGWDARSHSLKNVCPRKEEARGPGRMRLGQEVASRIPGLCLSQEGLSRLRTRCGPQCPLPSLSKL